MSETPQRAVITGLGIVSPLGIGWEPFESGLRAGKSGVAPITLIPASAIPGHIGGECRDFNDETAKSKWLKSQRKSLKVMSREIQMALTSAIVSESLACCERRLTGC